MGRRVAGARKCYPKDGVIWRRGRWGIGLGARLGRHNRELRRREKFGTVWTERNLLALLQEQGLLALLQEQGLLALLPEQGCSTKPPKTKCCRRGGAI